LALAQGTRLGVYEITSPIGEGGMGAVYRAIDTSLSRQVAIKVLLDALAADPDCLARFEREAKTLAALNHPQIAAIHAVEKSASRGELSSVVCRSKLGLRADRRHVRMGEGRRPLIAMDSSGPLLGSLALAAIGARTFYANVTGHFEGYGVVLGTLFTLQALLTLLHLRPGPRAFLTHA
jgi:serine/threonine protein kinase